MEVMIELVEKIKSLVGEKELAIYDMCMQVVEEKIGDTTDEEWARYEIACACVALWKNGVKLGLTLGVQKR